MPYEFPGEKWLNVLCDNINHSEAYQKAAANWEGDLTFVVKAALGVKADVYLYMDLWHGECRGVSLETNPVESEFRITAPYPTWRRVIEGKIDPIRAIMTKQLQVDGPLTKILKAPKAAVELVNCAKQVDTTWV